MTAPGWYPDPSDPSQQRWWDGTAWGQLAPQTPQPAPQAPVYPTPQPAPGPPAYAQPAYAQPQPAYAQPATAPAPPPSGGAKGSRTVLIVAAVVVVLAAAGAGAWFLLGGSDDIALDDVTSKLEKDDDFECEKARDIERKDLEELFESDGSDMPKEADEAFDTIEDADADSKFTVCNDPDDDDRGAAFISYDADGEDIVVLVIQSHDDVVDEADLEGVGVLTVPPDSGTTTESAGAAACQIERRTIETALEAFNASEGYYPDTLDELVGMYLDDAPSEEDWYYDSYEGTVEPMPGGTFSEDNITDC